MILTDEEVKERVESPLNLLNRLKRVSGDKSHSPCLPSPRANDILDNLDDKIKHGSLRQKAADIMTSALEELKIRIPDIQKPEKLAAIARDMNQVLISRQDQEQIKQTQIVVYAPQVISESMFETVVVRE